jgi:hypothetical protein
VLEGTLRSSICPGTLAGQCLNPTAGGAEHSVANLTTGVSDEQIELGSGGNVEHGVEVVCLICGYYRVRGSLAPGARVTFQIGICPILSTEHSDKLRRNVALHIGTAMMIDVHHFIGCLAEHKCLCLNLTEIITGESNVVARGLALQSVELVSGEDHRLGSFEL